MIFVTLGSQKFQFNRLLIELDKLVNQGQIKAGIYAQIGYSDYIPKYYRYEKFLDREQYEDALQKSEIVITHAGTGAIIGAVTKGKKVIAIPRLKKYGEHVDDHQLEILKQFEEMHIICPCYSCDDLKGILTGIEDIKLNAYPSNTKRMLDELDYVIKEIIEQ